MKKLLIVIDAQNDFITGALRNEEAIKSLPNLIKLINSHDGTIIATHDTHFSKIQIKAGWPPADNQCIAYENSLEGQKLPVPHCIKLTDGWELEPSVCKACSEKNNEGAVRFHCIDKYTFGYKDWEKYLKFYEFDEIVIAGYCTDICVVSNALLLRSIYPNKKITVIENACAGVTPETHKAAIDVMRMCQIDIDTI